MPATLALPPLPSPTLRARSVYERFEPSRIVGDMTEDEYLRFLAGAQEKHIYIDGKVIRVAGASDEHNCLVGDTLRALGNALEAADNGCEIYPSDVRVYVRPRVYYFPDLVVVCGGSQYDLREALRNPALIVEVLSHSTQEDDRTAKFADYQTIESLRHYVLIDQYQVCVTHYAKQADGMWSVAGEYRDLSDSLMLTDLGVSVPLSRIYRRVRFDAAP